MGQVERIGQAAQPLAGPLCARLQRHALCPQPYGEGEEQGHAQQVEDAVEERVGVAANLVGAHHGDDDERAEREARQTAGARGEVVRPARHQAEHQQSGKEREAHAGQADIHLFGRQRPSRVERARVVVRLKHTQQVERQGTVGQHHAKHRYQRGQCPAPYAEDEEAEQHVGHIFKHHRPLRDVQQKHLPVLAHVPFRRDGQHEETPQRIERQIAQIGPGDARIVRTLLKEEERRPQQDTEEHHRLQTDQTRPEEAPAAHEPAAHPLLIGVADDEAREDEEEIDAEVSVVEVLIHRVVRESLAQVEHDDHQGRHAAQAVQNVVAIGCAFCRGRERGCVLFVRSKGHKVLLEYGG